MSSSLRSSRCSLSTARSASSTSSAQSSRDTHGAAWEDLKLGTGYLSKWERCAIATDHTALADVIRAFGVLMPGEVKVFPAADVDKALAWAAG